MTLEPKKGAYEGSQVLDQHSLWLGLEQENNGSSSLLLLWVELWGPGPKSGSQRVGPTVVYPSQSQTMRSTAWPSPLQAERARRNGRRDLWAGKVRAEQQLSSSWSSLWPQGQFCDCWISVLVSARGGLRIAACWYLHSSHRNAIWTSVLSQTSPFLDWDVFPGPSKIIHEHESQFHPCSLSEILPGPDICVQPAKNSPIHIVPFCLYLTLLHSAEGMESKDMFGYWEEKSRKSVTWAA